MPGRVRSEPDLKPEQPEGDGSSRVTPVMPIPDLIRERDEGESLAVGDPASDESERGFWNAPPRYSVTGLSLIPAAVLPPPPRIRVWSARLLFGAVLCAVVALLGFETASWAHDATATHALLGPQK
ncbi:MAG TPA: hypothetical protein VHW01_23930 [Polyangiaceae bacterium]|jgi:hypothetical protein|nr:hypothetical protein [Polyangiaceae bacterium]